jgi:hypothetical protein
MKIHYKIKSENYEFYATITEIENHEYRIKFGGARQCINVSVYKDSNESSLANLNGVSYDLECSIDKNLLAGDGTASRAHSAAEMLKCCLKFLLYIYPNIKGYTFKDHSKVTCTRNVVIPLYYFYMIKHNKTWYQHKFNAKPKDKDEIIHINELFEFLKNESTKISLDNFYKTYVVASGCQLKNFKEFFGDIYNKSNCYYDFLKEIIDNYDCGILQIWFQYFMYKHCKFNFGEAFWLIRKSEINKWNNVTYEKIDTKPRFKKNYEGGFFPLGTK